MCCSLSVFLLLLTVLQSVKAFFARSDLYNVLNIVDKYLAVADVTCIKSLFGGLYNASDRHLADYDIDLHLWHKVGLNGNASVILGLALLCTVALLKYQEYVHKDQ